MATDEDFSLICVKNDFAAIKMFFVLSTQLKLP
jgi:hypothetical protein